jgi:hypothetical protein
VRQVGEQAVEDRQCLVALLDADVHVDAPDHHVATPPAGAVDELVIARLVGEVLVVPLTERVRTAADEFVLAELVDHGAHLGELAFEIGDCARHAFVHAAHELDRVREQLGCDRRMMPALAARIEQLERGVGDRCELTGDAVDDGDLPLDAHRGAR